jgi:deazaflavin-dependent oxidoreductase (nitroreductase family)
MGTEEPPAFLYVTTTGWRTGRPHRIEIWYVGLEGRYYLCSELWDRAHWVRNIQYNPLVTIELRCRRFDGRARVLSDDRDPDLVGRVKAAFDAKYRWSDGLLVELEPTNSSS